MPANMSKKKFKMRACAAAGREISATECRDQRGSRYVCPADCPHNPFAPANYARLLEIEGELDRKSLDWLVKDPQHASELGRNLPRLLQDGMAHAFHAFLAWRLFLRRDAAGLTSAEHWQRAGFSGLRNDERVLFQAKMRVRVALLEVHRVPDDLRTEAVDLFAPDAGPLLLADRSLAAAATRFAPLLAWIYPLPHFWRLSGTMILIPDMGLHEPLEIVSELVEHLGGPTTQPDLRRWLAEHFGRFDEALNATAQARRLRMFSKLDATWTQVAYELEAPFAECRALLDDLAEVDEDSLSEAERREGFQEGRVWLAARGAEVPPIVGQHSSSVLGRVLLGARHWRLEGMGKTRFAQLRARFEEHLGNRVRALSERRENLGEQSAGEEPEFDEALVPPRLLEEPEQLAVGASQVLLPPAGQTLAAWEANTRRLLDRQFLDEPVPALDGRTPREAARNPALRPRLIRLLKRRVRDQDEDNLRTGRAEDINWLLRELDLKEILFDPPPPRPRLDVSGEADDWQEEGARQAEAEREEPAEVPPLPSRPLEVEEAAERLGLVLKCLSRMQDGLATVNASGSTILQDVHAVVGPLLQPAEFTYLVTFLLEAWFFLVPHGAPAPYVDPNHLARALDAELETLVAALQTEQEDKVTRFLSDCRQPGLAKLLASQVINHAPEFLEPLRPRDSIQPVLLAMLKAFINEVDRAVRG